MNDQQQRPAGEEPASAATRRQFVSGAAVALGGVGLLGVPAIGAATGKAPRRRRGPARPPDSPREVLNISATIEGLGIVVTTVGAERVPLPPPVARNAAAAARHELLHRQWLIGEAGARPLTNRIWVPDAIFASPVALLSAIEVGESNEVNGYLVGTTVFAARGDADMARIFAELVANESVHRAVARDALGKLANDRAWAKYDQPEEAPDAPNRGQPGFRSMWDLFVAYETAGFGFGRPGSAPGAFHDVDEVSARTPDDPDVNVRLPR
ncbi:MAG TPA: hypothetical protein VNT51_08600 [Miltoncostaeaceae bacterium]|nr:hypothetical protein [Miltoncostaeaceae bacterium]